MKKSILVALSLSLSLLVVACNKTTATSTEGDLSESGNSVKVVENEKSANELSPAEGNTAEKENKKEEANKESQTKTKTSYDVSLSYPATAYIVDGNEEEKEVKSSITIEASKEELVDKVLKALKQAPTSEGAESTGLDKYTITSANLEGEKAVVNFSSKGLEGSSMDEEVLLRSVVNSLLSIKGIKSVEIQVDGQKAESLMGHSDISQAFSQFL